LAKWVPRKVKRNYAITELGVNGAGRSKVKRNYAITELGVYGAGRSSWAPPKT